MSDKIQAAREHLSALELQDALEKKKADLEKQLEQVDAELAAVARSLNEGYVARPAGLEPA